jgi:hypothetical protein
MKASLELLLRVAAVFNSLDYSPVWAEKKAQWPELREGGMVSSGDVSLVFSYRILNRIS